MGLGPEVYDRRPMATDAPPPRFSVFLDEGGPAPVLRMRGELDVAGAPELRSVLYPVLEDGRSVVVDCSELQFLDSTGLGVLIGGHKRAREHGQELRLRGATGSVAKVLAITGLDEILPIDP